MLQAGAFPTGNGFWRNTQAPSPSTAKTAPTSGASQTPASSSKPFVVPARRSLDPQARSFMPVPDAAASSAPPAQSTDSSAQVQQSTSQMSMQMEANRAAIQPMPMDVDGDAPDQPSMVGGDVQYAQPGTMLTIDEHSQHAMPGLQRHAQDENLPASQLSPGSGPGPASQHVVAEDKQPGAADPQVDEAAFLAGGAPAAQAAMASSDGQPRHDAVDSPLSNQQQPDLVSSADGNAVPSLAALALRADQAAVSEASAAAAGKLPTETQPTCSQEAARVGDEARRMGDVLRLGLAPIRTHSPTGASPAAGAHLIAARTGRSSPADRFNDAENSPPLAGTSPTRAEVSRLTAGMLTRMSSKSLKKSDSGLSLASSSSQGSAGQSPSSSRRSPLGLLRHLAHATIRRGFASHSTPNLAAMDAAAGDDSSDGSPHDLMHAMPEWARHHAYEPLMEPVREDVSEGITTPLGSLQDRDTWGTPRGETPRLVRSPHLPVGWRGVAAMGVEPVASSLSSSAREAASAAVSPPSGAFASQFAEPTHMGPHPYGHSQQQQQSGSAADQAWESMWNATPWDAALVGMASMQSGTGRRTSTEHPVGLGGWEQGSGGSRQMSHPASGLQVQQQAQRATHRATFSGGLQTQHQPTPRPLQASVPFFGLDESVNSPSCLA